MISAQCERVLSRQKARVLPLEPVSVSAASESETKTLTCFEAGTGWQMSAVPVTPMTL